jgi:hypothetical protein
LGKGRLNAKSLQISRLEKARHIESPPFFKRGQAERSEAGGFRALQIPPDLSFGKREA